jgi:hypothetical protein
MPLIRERVSAFETGRRGTWPALAALEVVEPGTP